MKIQKRCFVIAKIVFSERFKSCVFWSSVWCRRTDELVDGPNAVYMSSEVLERWEERLQDIFDGRPYDILDAALTDTVFKFPLDIKVLNCLKCSN